jgi:hypothetical protein
MPAPTPIVRGLTTIKWGPGSLTGATGGLQTAIIESYQFAPKNGGPIADIENNDGATIALVYLADGGEFTLNILYDSALTLPAVGDPISLKILGGAALGCTVSSREDSASRKKEGMLTFKAVYRPGVDISIA